MNLKIIKLLIVTDKYLKINQNLINNMVKIKIQLYKLKE